MVPKVFTLILLCCSLHTAALQSMFEAPAETSKPTSEGGTDPLDGTDPSYDTGQPEKGKEALTKEQQEKQERAYQESLAKNGAGSSNTPPEAAAVSSEAPPASQPDTPKETGIIGVTGESPRATFYKEQFEKGLPSDGWIRAMTPDDIKTVGIDGVEKLIQEKKTALLQKPDQGQTAVEILIEANKLQIIEDQADLLAVASLIRQSTDPVSLASQLSPRQLLIMDGTTAKTLIGKDIPGEEIPTKSQIIGMLAEPSSVIGDMSNNMTKNVIFRAGQEIKADPSFAQTIANSTGKEALGKKVVSLAQNIDNQSTQATQQMMSNKGEALKANLSGLEKYPEADRLIGKPLMLLDTARYALAFAQEGEAAIALSADDQTFIGIEESSISTLDLAKDSIAKAQDYWLNNELVKTLGIEDDPTFDYTKEFEPEVTKAQEVVAEQERTAPKRTIEGALEKTPDEKTDQAKMKKNQESRESTNAKEIRKEKGFIGSIVDRVKRWFNKLTISTGDYSSDYLKMGARIDAFESIAQQTSPDSPAAPLIQSHLNSLKNLEAMVLEPDPGERADLRGKLEKSLENQTKELQSLLNQEQSEDKKELSTQEEAKLKEQIEQLKNMENDFKKTLEKVNIQLTDLVSQSSPTMRASTLEGILGNMTTYEQELAQSAGITDLVEREKKAQQTEKEKMVDELTQGMNLFKKQIETLEEQVPTSATPLPGSGQQLGTAELLKEVKDSQEALRKSVLAVQEAKTYTPKQIESIKKQAQTLEDDIATLKQQQSLQGQLQSER